MNLFVQGHLHAAREQEDCTAFIIHDPQWVGEGGGKKEGWG
jgi:hypothetical protein